MPTVLIAIRDPEARASLAKIVKGSGRRVASVSSCREARRCFPGREYDVVFAEACGGEGASWGPATPTCRIAVLVDPPDKVLVDGLLPAGFHAQLSTPLDPNGVRELLNGTAPHGDVFPEGETDALPPPQDAESGPPPMRLLGRAPAMRQLKERIRCMAPAQAPVLIIGETGSGKELVARQLHELSDRSRGPFVAINCGALSPTLLESQLFGHERGSFTGAKPGLSRLGG